MSGHAGRAKRFLIYDVEQAAEPVEINRLNLPRELSCRGQAAAAGDPMDGVNVLLSASFRPSFAEFMAQRGIETVATANEDPVEAVRGYLLQRAAREVGPEGA